ncbi:MAG: hypothetical protein QM766_06275 [Burkholderiaceae bacterium]
MTSSDEAAALDALAADARGMHRACLRLLAVRDAALAEKVAQTHSRHFDLAGTPDDPANISYAALLQRLWPIAEHMPSIVAATIPRSSLWAATGELGDRHLVVMPAGVVSFYRRFCYVVFQAREFYAQSEALEEPIEQMSRLLGEQLEFGLLDFLGMDQLAHKSKPIIEHLTQLAYEFFLLHEACHIRQGHEEPVAHETTWYQEAHLRHANEFEADRWAFNTLLASFSNDMHLVAVAVAMLFDSLDVLDRFDFAPMTRLTHPSPAARKWRLMRLLEAPEALEFLDVAELKKAREFSMLYERLAAFITDRAKPATPLNIALNRGAEAGPDSFVNTMLPMLAAGDPARIVNNLSLVRGSSQEWAYEGTDQDAAWVSRVNRCIDALAHELDTMPRLRGLAAELLRAASSESRRAHEA